ncbi:MAG: LON peptidase substrate-binding domain-containing protein [Wenzhouxiangella sp.]|jgi:Lon protease-like protein|nr:LON peptidase substrate-binding domain-containing protein [Wenzhouxiangella sp.]
MSQSLPLFPLQTVLFPNAKLPLRIFERRYIDMVRDSMRAGHGFGVVARFPGDEKSPAWHAKVGTEAVITDFTTLEDGLLGLQTRGQRRFMVTSTQARDDGLLIGEIDWLAPEPARPVAPNHAALQTLIRELLRHAEVADQLEVEPDDASSLGFALASILPLELGQAQQLLEFIDPEERLDALLPLVEQAMVSSDSLTD